MKQDKVAPQNKHSGSDPSEQRAKVQLGASR